ncbi:MAG TPA: hypothetical protein VM243_01540 [Phycisphaerae bacterium]|nr:hypothetical protein [Phycisphaerae bacterium]
MLKFPARWRLILPVCLSSMSLAVGCRSSENFQGRLGEPCESNLDCTFELAC